MNADLFPEWWKIDPIKLIESKEFDNYYLKIE
jgi:hypothetical protein